MALVQPGDSVYLGGWTSVPLTLCAGLAEQAAALRDVTVVTFLTAFNWDRPELLAAFQIVTAYTGPYERGPAREGRFDYLPVAGFREGRAPNGFPESFDVVGVPISPPDEDGYCSFGGGVWFGPTVLRGAKAAVGEVHPEFIRTGGDNRVHISRFAALTENVAVAGPPPIPPRSEEAEIAAQVACSLIASEIIKDGATIQIGVGDVSAALALYLGDKHDLGIHSEIIPGGVADLVKCGAVTGRHKEVHPGKVVGAALVQMPPEELAYIDGNETFELYDFCHTDDMRLLLQLSNFVAVNNALFVDVTGNACGESWGPQVFSGPGGQPTFAYAASTTSAQSVIALPSSQMAGGERRPRLLAALPEGSTVTSHRAYVDYVVTEQGIARLTGKTLRGRIDELVSVAHPDFRAELRAEARKLYGV